MSHNFKNKILVRQLFPKASSSLIRCIILLLSSVLTVNRNMTNRVLAAAILHGNVRVVFILSNNKGMNLFWTIKGLIQLAKQLNFSKQSACSLQFLVFAIIASQWICKNELNYYRTLNKKNITFTKWLINCLSV